MKEYIELKEYGVKVSRDGEVISHKGKVLKHQVCRAGYHRVFCRKDGKRIGAGVHRLVALAYIPNHDPAKKTSVNHKNGIKSCNRVENLEWCSHKENIHHAWKTGLMDPVIAARTEFTRNEMIARLKTWGYTHDQIASAFKMSQPNVTRILAMDSTKESVQETA